MEILFLAGCQKAHQTGPIEDQRVRFPRLPPATPTNFHSAKSAKSNLNIYAQILFKAKRVKPNKIK